MTIRETAAQAATADLRKACELLAQWSERPTSPEDARCMAYHIGRGATASQAASRHYGYLLGMAIRTSRNGRPSTLKLAQ